MRVRYILSEGDAAAFLPSKSHGWLFRFSSFFFLPIVLYVWKWMRIAGFDCFFCECREVFEDVFGAY